MLFATVPIRTKDEIYLYKEMVQNEGKIMAGSIGRIVGSGAANMRDQWEEGKHRQPV